MAWTGTTSPFYLCIYIYIYICSHQIVSVFLFIFPCCYHLFGSLLLSVGERYEIPLSACLVSWTDYIVRLWNARLKWESRVNHTRELRSSSKTEGKYRLWDEHSGLLGCDSASLDEWFLMFQMKAARSFVISGTTHPVLQCHITWNHSSVKTSKLANRKIFVFKISVVGCEPWWCGR